MDNKKQLKNMHRETRDGQDWAELCELTHGQ